MKTATLFLAVLPAALLAQRAPAPPRIAVRTNPVQVNIPSAPALGGSFLSPGYSRPLGGITPPRTPVIRPTRRYSYAGPIYYVPNAFDAYAVADSGVAEAIAQRRSSRSEAPVIVNQYFSAPASDYTQREFQASSTPSAVSGPAAPGDPIGPQENYYLIAYKDHSIYSALAYWVEDNTLHYVTTQNTHNQASLGLIDVAETTKLNADKNVPFALAR